MSTNKPQLPKHERLLPNEFSSTVSSPHFSDWARSEGYVATRHVG